MERPAHEWFKEDKKIPIIVLTYFVCVGESFIMVFDRFRSMKTSL